VVARRTVSGCLVVAMILGQLAILQAKQLREQGSQWVRQYEAFGYAPNLIAALTVPCLVLAIALKSRRFRPDEPHGWARLRREQRAIAVAVLLAVAALLSREFLQVFRPNFIFDWQDVYATLAGGVLLFTFSLIGRGLTVAPATASRGAGAPAPENTTP
jgi:hypothetical protein